jgi:hypothetical protein
VRRLGGGRRGRMRRTLPAAARARRGSPKLARWLAPASLAALLAAQAFGARASEPLDLFRSESQAKQHCGHDVVVWLNVTTNRYEVVGKADHQGTAHGGYTCERDAIRARNRPMR